MSTQMADSKMLTSGENVYENDLTLAAELGKALLERNRDLEAQVGQLQQVTSEYRLENDHLNRQLDILREMNDSRMRVYEELDKNAQELESVNRLLREEIKTNHHQMNKFTTKNKQLETDLDDVYKQLEEVKAIEANRLKEDKRKTQSVPSIQDAVSMEIRNVYRKASNWISNTDNVPQINRPLPKNPYECEIEKLRNDVSHIKAKLVVEKSKCEMLESDVVDVVRDNQMLEAKVRELQDTLLEAKMITSELSLRPERSDELCAKCAHELSPPECFATEVEHDDPQLGSEGKFVKLGDGGSIYGSDESINRVVSESGELVITQNEFHRGIPILNELDAQYNALISKYESLITNLTKRASGDFDDVVITDDVDKIHKEVQTLLNTQKSQPVTVFIPKPSCSSQTEPCQLNPSPPPTYKYLFKDIYATLEKSHSIGEVPLYKSDSSGSSGKSRPKKSPTKIPRS